MNKKVMPNKATLENLLTDKEREIFYLSFGFLQYEPMSLTEVAKFTGKSKETVRRAKVKVINKLKENPEVRELFKDFI
jgi:DNA-directed RNA polymerase sigma subunit (sigma70/sigma32)